MSDRVRGALDLRAWIENGDERAQHRGHALDEQQAEADRQHRLQDPAMRQPSRIGRFLADIIGPHDVGDRQLEQDGDDDDDEYGRDELDDTPQALGEAPNRMPTRTCPSLRMA